MTLQEFYTENRNKLFEVTSDAAFDMKLLICHALQMTESTFFMNMHLILTDEQTEALNELIDRRLSGEPLQYILGKWSFMGYDFYVSPDCLIPRQDTETLVEYACREILRHNYTSVLDICTGSGCIAISISKSCGAKITASDLYENTLQIAIKNAQLNNARVDFIISDIFDSIDGSFDVITANPPYLTEEEMKFIQKEMTFEPYNALCGGEDGMFFYKKIAETYREHLNEGGMLLLEVGEQQADKVAALFENAEIIKDLCGKQRVVKVV